MEGLNSKVKLGFYEVFSMEVEFKRYLHRVSDAGTRLLFKFRSGTHGLVGIRVGMAGLSVFYVAMGAKVLSMFYGSVLLTRIVGKRS